MKKNLWIYFVLSEILIMFAYLSFQPLCELCLPNLACPPCISKEQIFLSWLGVTLLIFFLVRNVLKIFKRKDTDVFV